jgi:hypothetical protein
MKLNVNLTWETIVCNPLLADLKDKGVIFLHPSNLNKASKPLQDKLMSAYKEYISLCLSAPIDTISVDYNDAVAKIKLRTDRVYQELYKIKPVRDTVDIKLGKVVVSKFTVTQVIDQSPYTFQKTWVNTEGYKQKYLIELFEKGVEITLDPKYIYKVEGLVGHDGYLYSHEDRQGNLYWAILATDKLIW